MLSEMGDRPSSSRKAVAVTVAASNTFSSMCSILRSLIAVTGSLSDVSCTHTPEVKLQKVVTDTISLPFILV